MDLRKWFWGRLSPIGLGVALAALAADQLHKWWMIHVYDIGARGRVEVTPFLDLVMVWNTGISYGLLSQDGPLGKILLISFAAAVTIGLVVWLARLASRLLAVSVGLIIGGALGNVIDRAVYGAVADFFSFHAYGFYWYVFNIADVAIVAGVIGLLYDSLFPGHKIDLKQAEESRVNIDRHTIRSKDGASE